MIPEGYRLLTSADVGKVFGTDLESMVYFDEDVTPTFYLTSNGELNLTNFCEERRGYLPIAEEEISSGIYLYGNTNNYIYFSLMGSFNSTEADLSGVEITSFNTDYSWNNWFYVKDIANPYNIVIKNKEGIKLLTKDKTIEFDDDVKITIDESLLGSGEAKKYNFTLTHENDLGGNSGPERYSVDGGEFISTPNSGSSVELTGNYLVLYGVKGTGISLISGVFVIGGTFVGAGLDASDGIYSVIFVTITEDNAQIYYDTYD